MYFLEIFRLRMYSNNKNCEEARKIKPNLFSALKLYVTSILCNLAGQNSDNIVKNRVEVEKA